LIKVERERKGLFEKGYGQLEGYRRELVEYESQLTNELVVMSDQQRMASQSVEEQLTTDTDKLKQDLAAHSTDMHDLLETHGSFVRFILNIV
jgi:hypothetical protein